ncbi:RecQ family ATP-dependent DNA helicase [Flavobacterium sp.]
MSKALEILKRYWKHDSFRSLQQDIIHSVMDEKDTFALMPTGGGKSICFQVPAMLNEGLCLVISPLVALMKDQVQNLQNKGIKAIALTGGIHENEIIELLDNCQYGNYKFLYLSPERLQSDWILERVKNFNINLIAVDEAHCISQWGNDFRPAYLKINQLKEYFPKVAFLALTATATPRVQSDIIEKLSLKDCQVFTKSFVRENLAYMVFQVEDKLFLTQQILKKNPQSSIIYVTNRKSCIEISSQLEKLGFSTTYYHGGLLPKEKENHMNLWMKEKVQVMVATNAFGMGIDKANVKTIIHLHLPSNLENYYQEAGRAGRNGEKSYAVLLVHPSDLLHAESQFIYVLPDKNFLNIVFKKLCNFLRIGYGEGINDQFNFNFNQFCLQYNLPILKTYNSLKFIDNQGIITFSQEFSEKIALQFLISSKEVIRYISLNSSDEEIILTILRTYPGIYDLKTSFNTQLIAKKSNATEEKVLAVLEKLNAKKIIELNSKQNDTSITFNEVREDERTINRVTKSLEQINSLKIEQLKSVVDYVSNIQECKNKTLLAYFGEIVKEDCGICSYCIAKKEAEKDNSSLITEIFKLLKTNSLTSREIQNSTKARENEVITALQTLMEDGKIIIKPNNSYSLKNK